MGRRIRACRGRAADTALEVCLFVAINKWAGRAAGSAANIKGVDVDLARENVGRDAQLCGGFVLVVLTQTDSTGGGQSTNLSRYII